LSRLRPGKPGKQLLLCFIIYAVSSNCVY
jgi:hypothetical protein